MDRFILVVALTGLTLLLLGQPAKAQSAATPAGFTAELSNDPPRTCAAARVRTQTRVPHPYTQQSLTPQQADTPASAPRRPRTSPQASTEPRRKSAPATRQD